MTLWYGAAMTDKYSGTGRKILVPSVWLAFLLALSLIALVVGVIYGIHEIVEAGKLW